jgi:hypothetical protein
MPLARLAFVALSTLVASRCLNASTLIRVTPSGSGNRPVVTVEFR